MSYSNYETGTRDQGESINYNKMLTLLQLPNILYTLPFGYYEPIKTYFSGNHFQWDMPILLVSSLDDYYSLPCMYSTSVINLLKLFLYKNVYSGKTVIVSLSLEKLRPREVVL